MEEIKLEEEISDLILRYITDDEINLKFYNELINIFRSNLRLQQVLDSEVSINDDMDGYAAYLNNKVIISPKKIKDILENLNRQLGTIFKDYDMLMLEKLVLTRIIRHELEHAVQSKILHDGIFNTLEEKIIKNNYGSYKSNAEEKLANNGSTSKIEEIMKEFQINDEKYYKLYNQYYELVPIEHLAQVKSCKTIKCVTEILELDQNFNNFVNYLLYNFQIYGYHIKKGFAIGPTLEFLEILKNNDLLTPDLKYYDEDHSISLSKALKDLSFEERLDLGLTITKNEFKQKNKDGQVLYKKLNKPKLYL